MINRIEKKGDVTMSNLVWAIVAIMVIVLLFFAFPILIRFMQTVGLLAPNFNQSEGRVEGIETLRYQILNEKVEYYDGTTWLPFKTARQEMDDKVIVESEIRSKLKSSFYDKNARSSVNREILLSPKARDTFYTENYAASFPFLDAEIVDISSIGKEETPENSFFYSSPDYQYLYKPGNVIIRLYSHSRDIDNNNKIYGEFSLSIDNKLGFRKLKEDNTLENSFKLSPDTGDYLTIKNRAIAWRDNVFETPIEVPYHEVVDGKFSSEIKNARVCMEKKGSSVVVDLLKTTNADKCFIAT